MTKEEYMELKLCLLGKRYSSRYQNRTREQSGYDRGIETAVSKIREVYNRQFKD